MTLDIDDFRMCPYTYQDQKNALSTYVVQCVQVLKGHLLGTSSFFLESSKTLQGIVSYALEGHVRGHFIMFSHIRENPREYFNKFFYNLRIDLSEVFSTTGIP